MKLVLFVLAPTAFLFFTPDSPWTALTAVLSAMAFTGSARCVTYHTKATQILGIAGILAAYVTTWPWMMQAPATALLITLIVIAAAFAITTNLILPRFSSPIWALMGLGTMGIFALSSQTVPMIISGRISITPDALLSRVPAMALVISIGISLNLWLKQSSRIDTKKSPQKITKYLAFTGGLAVLTTLCFAPYYISFIAIGIATLCIVTSPKYENSVHKLASLEFLVNHPARILLTTFLALCIAGTLVLSLPMASARDGVSILDAAFTAVSAVCVTGLAVLDTATDFTRFGQVCLIVMIQLGGLGIMGIATVALHAMGRRMSLKHERLMTKATGTDHHGLLQSLKTILLFTATTEAVGAFILTISFLYLGDDLAMAIWRGLFTSISAFCNAGFALQSDSLMGYQTAPFVLHTIACLIILGGLAPAVALQIPRWIQRRPVALPTRVALHTTAVLLITGMFFTLAFEWNGALASLDWIDRFHNAWFHSVTLRTAGFNAIDVAAMADPTFVVMILLMFVGGSPGGTAGGIKTNTVAILAMTFWASITHHRDIVIQNRRIPPENITRAVAILTSGLIVLFLATIMLQTTQEIPARDLIFEATSALGTVGLTSGATPQLDEIGKIIVMFSMFIGRIGAMTLFLIVSDDQEISSPHCPDENIPMT